MGVAETQQNDAVRKVRRRRTIYLVASLITIPLFALFTIGTVVSVAENAYLLSTGIRVTGMVDSVDRSGKGDAVDSQQSMVVAFPVGALEHTAEIDLSGTSTFYAIRASVQVIYDPRDPTQVRTDREGNLSLPGLIVVDPILALLALVAGNGGIRWGRRARALRGAVWDRGRATRHPLVAAGRRRRLSVRVKGGHTLELCLPRPEPHELKYGGQVDVMVAGAGTALTVYALDSRAVFAARPVRERR